MNGGIAPRMDSIAALGEAIRSRVEAARLEDACELARKRHREVVALFDDPELDRSDDAVAYWLQGLVREDGELLHSLAELRRRMEFELSESRRAAQSARSYVETAQGGTR